MSEMLQGPLFERSLVAMTDAGLRIEDEEISAAFDRKSLSPSLVSSVVDENACMARMLASSFVVDRLVTPPVDTDASRGSMFHKVMEEFFSLPPEERTNEGMNQAFRDVLASDKFRDLGGIPDARDWLVRAVRGYFKMGSKPDRVRVAELDVGHGARPGLEVFVKGQIGAASRPTLGFVDRVTVDPRDGKSLVVEDYKGLALDTPIPTPFGWSTMGSLRVGDFVLGTTGACRVTVKSSVHYGRPCFRVGTADGGALVADNVHLWYVALVPPGGFGGGVVEYAVVSTERMAEFVRAGYLVLVPSPDPWEPKATVSGGAVNSVSGGSVDGGRSVGFYYGMSLGLMDSGNLDRYIQAHGSAGGEFSMIEVADRALAGTMDNIFTIPASVRQDIIDGIIHVSTVEAPADAPAGLAGFRWLRFNESPDGPKAISTILLDLMYLSGMSPMRMFDRSLDDGRGVTEIVVRDDLYAHPLGMEPGRCMDAGLDGGWREITVVEAVDSVPTQCIQVDSPDSLYLAGRAMITTHNTGKVKRWKPNTKGDKGLAEQRQQTIYSMLLEQHGFEVSAARLIYPVYGEIVNVNKNDEWLRNRVVEDIERADVLMKACRDENLFEYSPSFLCAWCPLAKLCPVADIKGGKCQVAFQKQPEPEQLLAGIKVR